MEFYTPLLYIRCEYCYFFIIKFLILIQELVTVLIQRLLMFFFSMTFVIE